MCRHTHEYQMKFHNPPAEGTAFIQTFIFYSCLAKQLNRLSAIYVKLAFPINCQKKIVADFSSEKGSYLGGGY